jgi:hypothetical protein
MSNPIPNHYHTAILQFKLHILESTIRTCREGVLAILQLIDFIDFYQVELAQQNFLGQQNQALSSVLTLRNSLVETLNHIYRM